LKSIAFLDSKRPYTKEVLKRIDLLKLSNLVGFDFVCDFADKMKGEYTISRQQFDDFQSSFVSIPLRNIAKQRPALTALDNRRSNDKAVRRDVIAL
jgi:hypothetical protein